MIAGCNKLAGDGGFKAFAWGSRGMIPDWAPRDASLTYLAVLPFAEVLVGLLIVLGLVTRLGGFLASLILISIEIALGKDGIYANGLPHPNLVFLSLTLMLVFVGGGSISLDGLFWGKRRAGFGAD